MINMLDRIADVKGDESGFTTAELLGNAAMAIVALVAIWGIMRTAGVDLVGEMFDKIRNF